MWDYSLRRNIHEVHSHRFVFEGFSGLSSEHMLVSISFWDFQCIQIPLHLEFGVGLSVGPTTNLPAFGLFSGEVDRHSVTIQIDKI